MALLTDRPDVPFVEFKAELDGAWNDVIRYSRSWRPITANQINTTHAAAEPITGKNDTS